MNLRYASLLRQMMRCAAPPMTPATTARAGKPAQQAADHGAASAAQTGDPDGEERPGCGWFDSSLALRQGLAVTEWVVAERSLQRLGSSPTARAAPGTAGSARLH